MNFKLILSAGLYISLTACANIAKTPDNTPYTSLLTEFGRPSIECQNPDGQTRVIWSTQPMGQYAWGGNLDANGNLVQMQSILTDEHFEVLRQGTWTTERVRCEFGSPAFIDSVGLPSNRQTVWNYRYKQDHVWNSLMFVFFDPATGLVTTFHPGPDPMYDRDYFMSPMF